MPAGKQQSSWVEESPHLRRSLGVDGIPKRKARHRCPYGFANAKRFSRAIEKPLVQPSSNERFAHLRENGRGAFTAYAVLIALSAHSFMAGLALGAQPELAGALVIFLAIMAHKSIGGFALGVSLVRNRMPTRRAWSLLALFSAATPLGILVGAGVGEALDGRLRVACEAAFLALAAGSFAYVATLDILRDEFLEPGGR